LLDLDELAAMTKTLNAFRVMNEMNDLFDIPRGRAVDWPHVPVGSPFSSSLDRVLSVW
jgi:hypothetical protein